MNKINKIVGVFLIVFILCFLIISYDRRPIFTYFGIGPFYLFSVENPIDIDTYGNYMYADERFNIILVVITGFDQKNDEIIPNRFPYFIDRKKCMVFGGTKYESILNLDENYIIFLNAKTKIETRMPIEIDFVKNNLKSLYRKIYYDNGIENTNIIDEIVNLVPDISKSIDALR